MTDKYYQALGQNVFVREIKVERKSNGFVMPDTLDNDFMYGEIVTCSDGYFDQGSFVPLNLIPGDKVADFKRQLKLNENVIRTMFVEVKA